MTRLHHVNLGVPPDGADAEGEFLVGVLGYRHLEPPEQAQAHTAIEVGDEISTVADRLRAAGVEFGDSEFDGRRILFCQDPAGNRWELRS